MSSATKALILTWVAIGFLIVGVIGFYLGRVTAPPKVIQMQQPGGMMQQQLPGGQQPGQQQFGPGGTMPGGQQQPGGRLQQSPQPPR